MERSNQIKEKCTEFRSLYTGTPILENQLFDLGLISKLISKLANSKAAGLDELSSEHLKYSNPIVICVLTKLFNLFILYRCIFVFRLVLAAVTLFQYQSVMATAVLCLWMTSGAFRLVL